MMAVLVLIGLVMALVSVAVLEVLNQGKVDTARIQAQELAKSVDVYRMRFGKYPSQQEGLAVLVSPPRGSALLKRVPKDPWNQDFVYVIPGEMNPGAFDIRSRGMDEEAGTIDDVGNWPEAAP